MKLTPSQICSFVYCSKSWHLTQTIGFKPTKQTIKGEQHHQKVSQNQTKAKVLNTLIKITITILIIFIIYRVFQ
tara:strand:+ start:312 stop:533 length:222 start_codon:yes stop_codon:yes gene_type:complete